MASNQKRILDRLADSRNLAVERVAEAALAGAGSAEQGALVDVLIKRNNRSGWIAMIRHFDRLSIELQDRLLEHPKELFGPLSEAIGDHEGAGRTNVIDIIRKASDPRLVLLLIEALSDMREEVRQLAAKSFVEAIRNYRAGSPVGEDAALPDPQRLRRAVEFALQQYKAHRQDDVVLAALLFERMQDGPLWPLFADPYDDLARTAANLLRSLAEPALAGAALLALTTPLKTAALQGLAVAQAPELMAQLARESYRLVDPTVRRAAESFTHCKGLEEVPEEAPWTDDTWLEWFGLVDRCEWAPQVKLAWLAKMLATSPEGDAGVPRKLLLLAALGRIEMPEAVQTLTELLKDVDRRVARSAKRVLARCKPLPQSDGAKRSDAWHPQLGTAASVRRAVNGPAAPGQFERVWDEFAGLPPAVQTSAARSLAESDGQFIDQLRAKLSSDATAELAQGLRMLTSIQKLAPFRDQIIALCGHPDARLVATAVKLLGRLADPQLGNLLDAAARHADPRVRANAVESMDELHIANRSTQLLGMLNSRHNRERANAIKAISTFDFLTARDCLVRMLNDNNAHHRLSALWVVGQLGMLDIVRQVAGCARLDAHPRVRKVARDMVVQLNEAASIQSAKA